MATPELAAAARKTLDVRGDDGTGWGLAMKTAMWVRLGDGNRAARLLGQLLKPAEKGTAKNRWSGGTFANLFDACPPFQIDGNFGGTAAIAEMLLQSETAPEAAGFATEIHLLPALPDAWSEGAVRGLRARGGFEVAIEWRAGKLVWAEIKSVGGTTARVRWNGTIRDVNLQPGEVTHIQ